MFLPLLFGSCKYLHKQSVPFNVCCHFNFTLAINEGLVVSGQIRLNYLWCQQHKYCAKL